MRFALARGLPVGLATAALWSVVAAIGHARMVTGLDLGIFDEAVRHLARGEAPVSTLKAPGFMLWGDHFHPIIAAWAPLYWLWESPVMLLVGQAIAAGVTAGMLAAWGHARAGHAGWVLGALAGIAPGMAAGMVFDVHEVALGMPILALGLILISDDRPLAAAGVLAGMILVKEDAAFVLCGAALALWLRGHRRTGAVLGTVGLGWTTLATGVIIPALNPDGVYPYTSKFDLAQVPSSVWSALVTPGAALATAVILLVAAGLRSWRSPLIWVAVAPFAVQVITPDPDYWALQHHYWLLPTVALAVAAIDVARREGHPWDWRIVVAVVVCAAFSLVTIGRTTLPGCPRCADAHAAFAQIPDGARVGADVYLVPHLTGRALVSEVQPLGHRDAPHRIEEWGWLILDRETLSYGRDWVDAYLADLGDGWLVVSDVGGYVIARRL